MVFSSPPILEPPKSRCIPIRSSRGCCRRRCTHGHQQVVSTPKGPNRVLRSTTPGPRKAIRESTLPFHSRKNRSRSCTKFEWNPSQNMVSKSTNETQKNCSEGKRCGAGLLDGGRGRWFKSQWRWKWWRTFRSLIIRWCSLGGEGLFVDVLISL